jgi:hypothetical protein
MLHKQAGLGFALCTARPVTADAHLGDDATGRQQDVAQ